MPERSAIPAAAMEAAKSAYAKAEFAAMKELERSRRPWEVLQPIDRDPYLVAALKAALPAIEAEIRKTEADCLNALVEVLERKSVAAYRAEEEERGNAFSGAAESARAALTLEVGPQS